jgi:transposase
VYTDMEQWAQIRHRVLVDGVSKRQIMRETGMHWQTLEKILSNSNPPGYCRKKPCSSKLDAHVDWVKAILESDKSQHKKQRHTSKRIFERLKAERGFDGGYSIVKELVFNLRRSSQEVFMPLDQPPGEAQVDYFQALANIDGILQKVHCFTMCLPYSDMFFVKAYPQECTESFWDGHVDAFRFFGGVPNRISYDNSRIAIRQITGCHLRVLTEGFLRLQSHYLFESHFCTVRRPNEKGVVENIVRYARSNFMVPVPQVNSFGHLNEILWEACWNEQSRKLRGKDKTKLDLWMEESECFRDTPEVPFDPCQKSTVIANSLSLVRYKSNDYSVPTIYAHNELTVKAYVDKIVICTQCGDRIAEHGRIWSKQQISYDPIHYLDLLTRKPGSLDYAGPIKKLELPDSFEVLRRKLESQSPDKHEGTRQYIKILQLLTRYPLNQVSKAIDKALRLSNPGVDIVSQYCMDIEQPSAITFNLAGREHLAGVNVASPRLDSYDHLKGEVI